MPFNIQIIGVGGQGVVTLAKLFQNLCLDNGIRCTGSIIKGGAQRLGTVQAALRIFVEETTDYRNYSMEIPNGKLDLMIALEPWEGLRFHRLCSSGTIVLMNSEIVPLMIERSFPVKVEDPVSMMKKLGFKICTKNFTTYAIQNYNSKKMVNYVMGKFAVEHYLRFFTCQQFDDRFQAATGSEL